MPKIDYNVKVKLICSYLYVFVISEHADNLKKTTRYWGQTKLSSLLHTNFLPEYVSF